MTYPPARCDSAESSSVAALLRALGRSPAMSVLIAEAEAQGWQAGFADLESIDFHIDVPARAILLNSSGLDPRTLMESQARRHMLTAALARALRDVWHEKRQGGFEERFSLENVLLLERVRAADCAVYALLGAWEMRAAGYDGLWCHMLTSDSGDVALVFGATMEKTDAHSPLHEALAAAFDQWFRAEDRVAPFDHETLDYVDALVQNGGAGTFGVQALTPLIVESLSCLPDKTAYLQGRGREIMRAPLYAGLSDTVNQNHFLQIARESQGCRVQGVLFRDAALADKIFPGGTMSEV